MPRLGPGGSLGRGLGVQFSAPSYRADCGGRAIEQSVVEEGIRLTVIGMGVAFAVLLLLTLLLTLSGRFVGPGSRLARGEAASPQNEPDLDPRDKALAAVAAVSAALSEGDDSDSPRGGDPH